jgi:hypothetical protein
MDTSRTAQHWKTKVAQSIFRPDLAGAPDEALENAHLLFMQAVKDGKVAGLPPEIAKFMRVTDAPKTTMPGCNASANARRLQVEALVNEKQALGGVYADYNVAFDAVRRENPTLFAAMTQPSPRK